MKGLITCALLALTSVSQAQSIPRAALEHRSELIRNARAIMGLNAPVSLIAAQIHQESAWKPNAKSWVGAQGLAQFMPATADWISKLYPELRANTPYNSSWALRAVVRYDDWLFKRITAANNCQRWAMTLSAYNGGLGWIYKDQALATRRGLNKAMWFGHVATVNSGRSKANWNENRTYPQRIIYTHQPRYLKAGWGPGACL